MEFIFSNMCVWLLFILPGVISNFLYEDSHYDIKVPGVQKSNYRQAGEDPRLGCLERFICDKKSVYREFDGTCNNRKNPSWGSSGIMYRRFIPAEYNNDLSLCGSNNRRPTARKVVSALNSLPIRNNSQVTVLLMQWGQFISHDCNLTPRVPSLSCCVDCKTNPTENENCLAVDVRNDSFFGQFGVECIENRRSLPAGEACGNTREQLNFITAYIDGNHVYGITKEAADGLRTFSNGQMKVLDRDEDLQGRSCPANSVCPFTLLPTVLNDEGEEEIIAGDSPRLIQQPMLTSVHNLCVRAHNDIASKLAELYSDADDETLYQEARQIVIALIQHITYNEFLPTILPLSTLEDWDIPSLPPYWGYFKGYNKFIDASLRNAFSTAGFRFGHTLVPDIISLSNGGSFELPTSFLNNGFTSTFGTYSSEILNGMSTQRSQNVDQNLASSVANQLFASAPSFEHGSDLYSRNIMRGRDHGLPSYNKWREFCNLPRIENFRDLREVVGSKPAKVFEDLYKSVDDIDLYPAAISERVGEDGGIVGPTLACLLGEQFWRLKVGDRFYYENKKHPNKFTLDQLDSIRRTSLSALLCRYTNTRRVPEFAMKVLGRGNRMKNCGEVLAGTIFTEFEDFF